MTQFVFREACKLGCEGIVSKRLGSPYRSGRSVHWVKIKNPNAPAMKRETEEDWGVDQKEAPLPGLKKDYSTSHKFLGANAGRAGIVARFFAVFLSTSSCCLPA